MTEIPYGRLGWRESKRPHKAPLPDLEDVGKLSLEQIDKGAVAYVAAYYIKGPRVGSSEILLFCGEMKYLKVQMSILMIFAKDFRQSMQK